MGRYISSGTSPGTILSNLELEAGTIGTTIVNQDLNLSPNGTGVVKVPSNYTGRAGVDANTLVPKRYADNNISPGLLYIDLS